jgi:hypothetical protein
MPQLQYPEETNAALDRLLVRAGVVGEDDRWEATGG